MRAERIERASHGVGTGGLARVRDRREPTFAGDGERGLVELRRVLGLEAAEPEADDAAVAVGDRVAGSRLCLVVGVAARDVRRQAYLDAVQLPRLLGAVAIAGEHLVAVDPPPQAGREDPLQVDGAVARRLRRVVDHDLAEVVRSLKRRGREQPDLDEVREVAKLVEPGEALDCVGRQRVVVPPRDLEQRVRPHGPLEVDVELDLRVRHEGSTAATSRSAQRRSMSTASQIVPS